MTENNDHIARMNQLHKNVRPSSDGLPKPNKDSIIPLKILISLIIDWHYDRNLIKGSTDKDQALKLLQELGELSDSICKGGDIRDDLGDMLVVMLNIMERNGLSFKDCLEKAWEDIKDRKGRMVDGIFVKETDLKNNES
tara:strand:+ start:4488 stop:4904 length:417 start_codon:yes stop_codon:yes gene_type:complete